ncbi:MAG: hypothetical protein AAGC78_02340 [Cellvibrio sp.]|uniref:hypothetical protein n=1 Tax=Cellvibrio sp. TaxID=1965322 RepID=UPI0031ACFED5
MNNSVDFLALLERVRFVERYGNICKLHSDFSESMSGGDKDKFLEILRVFDPDVKYVAKEKIFFSQANVDGFLVKIGLVLKNGIVEVFVFFIQDDNWLFHGRFDSVAGKILTGFKEKFKLPRYSSYLELKDILAEIFEIFMDIKKELRSQF